MAAFVFVGFSEIDAVLVTFGGFHVRACHGGVQGKVRIWIGIWIGLIHVSVGLELLAIPVDLLLAQARHQIVKAARARPTNIFAQIRTAMSSKRYVSTARPTPRFRVVSDQGSRISSFGL